MLLVARGLATRNQTKIKNSASKKRQGGNDRSSYVAQRTLGGPLYLPLHQGSYGRLVDAFRDA